MIIPKIHILTFCLAFATLSTSGQSERFSRIGGRHIGLSCAGTSLADGWSTIQNPASTSHVEEIALGASYQTLYSGTEYKQTSFAVLLPTSTGNIGVSFSQIGIPTYHENYIGLSFGKNLWTNISLGLRFGYESLYFPEETKSKGTYTLSFGAFWKISKELAVGFDTRNLISGKIESLSMVYQPDITFNLALHYQIIDPLLLILHNNYVESENIESTLAFEYKFPKLLQARFGLRSSPFRYSSGIGIYWKKIQFDLAVTHHPQLGLSSTISVAYFLQKKHAQ